MKIKSRGNHITMVIAMGLIPSMMLSVASGGEEVQTVMEQKPQGDFLQPFGSIRARYEFAEVDGFDKSTLGSIRTRAGLKTRSIGGLSFLAEGEHTYILTGSNKYRPFPGFPPANRSVIADPDNFQLNRIQLSYDIEPLKSSITIGRQAITFDDQRFIGAVGWRQNDQTFDAVRLENNSLDNVKFSYAYISQVNRIFGENTPARGLQEWDSDSHLVQVEYSGIENHKLRLFSYLLDFGNAAANSTNTYGVELAGKSDSRLGELHYILTAAIQNDAAENSVDYQEFYFRGQVGVTHDSFNYGVGAEVMTSDGAGRFLMPLGTNHKFNGFADAFLTSPVNGLIDTYSWVGTEALGAKHKLVLHNFQSEELSSSIGWEIDYVASKNLCTNALALFKVAYLVGDNGQADTTRASLELNYTF